MVQDSMNKKGDSWEMLIVTKANIKAPQSPNKKISQHVLPVWALIAVLREENTMIYEKKRILQNKNLHTQS